MKKVIFFSFVLFFSICSYAQLGFGIKGAFTISKLTTDIEDYSDAAKMNYQFGAFLRFGEKVHLQPELYYTTKSGQVKFAYTPDGQNPTVTRSVDQEMKFHTLDLPVLLGIRLLKLPKFNVHLHAGPLASVVLNKKFDVSFDGITVDEGDSPILADDFSNVNWAFQFGGGIDFLFLTADLRYELGLNNIYKAPTSDDPTIKNNVFVISVGWKIL